MFLFNQIQSDSCSIFQIKPPTKYVFESKVVAERQKLNSVVWQNCSKVNNSGMFELLYDKQIQMCFSEFKKEAMKIQHNQGNLTIAQLEDLHWERMADPGEFTPKYSIDNHFSLFPKNCQHWNLAKFGYEHSIIHSVNICFIFQCVHVFLNYISTNSI